MSAKKLGKAKILLDEQLWALEAGGPKFEMNLRLIEARPEVKEVRKGSKTAFARPPKRHQAEKREAYFKAREDYRERLRKTLARAYEEVERESHELPVPLRKHRDYEHTGQWRYCLFHGMIYQFDRPGYSSDEMVEQIASLERPA